MRLFRERLPGMPPIDERGVRAALADAGRWNRVHEWRLSTYTETEIVRTNASESYRAYRVSVTCSFELSADTPTIERAIEIASRYERLVQELWRDVGWPTSES